MHRSYNMQTTLAKEITFSGVGIHCNHPAVLTLYPAPEDTGIIFTRQDGSSIEIPACWKYVTQTDFCTVIGSGENRISTIEHLMSALMGLGVDNIYVEIDGPEVPIMDGSAAAFANSIHTTGLVFLDAPRRYLKILQPIRVDSGAGFVEIYPYNGTRYEVSIDFPNPVIQQQSLTLDLTPNFFLKEIAKARTFGFIKDLERLFSMGLCRGANLDNAIGLTDDGILNPEGLRWKDEFVRHKVLDSIGDLALMGMPFLGCFRSFRGGHTINIQLLKALFSKKSAWSILDSNSLSLGKSTTTHFSSLLTLD